MKFSISFCLDLYVDLCCVGVWPVEERGARGGGGGGHSKGGLHEPHQGIQLLICPYITYFLSNITVQ